MKKRSSFRDIQRFNEIAEILNISFDQAQELSLAVNSNITQELYEIVLMELPDNEAS